MMRGRTTELGKRRIPTAGYGRLDAGENAGDHSRSTQIATIQEFVKNSEELEYIDTYFDLNFAETDFQRPDFIRMMDDVRRKKIGCIVVKDLSRFGRNFLEAGYYIETIFPFLGIRLISVSDHFDSSRKKDMDELTVSMKKMAASLFSRELSRKIWDSFQEKKQKGLAGGNFAPFGYLRNPQTLRNEVDPEMALYVQLIYQWKLLGASFGDIAERLELLGVPTPRQRLYQLGLVKTPQEGKWNVSTLRVILSNQTYVGDTVSNKTSQALFAGQEKVLVAPKDWIITPHTHPAIIARDDFERVQELNGERAERIRQGRLGSRKKRRPQKDELQGLVYCAECGARMEYERLPYSVPEEKKIGYYVCKAPDMTKACRGHRIAERVLKTWLCGQRPPQGVGESGAQSGDPAAGSESAGNLRKSVPDFDASYSYIKRITVSNENELGVEWKERRIDL